MKPTEESTRLIAKCVAPRSGARSLAGVKREARNPRNVIPVKPRTPAGCEEFAVALTGGIARYARSTPG